MAIRNVSIVGTGIAARALGQAALAVDIEIRTISGRNAERAALLAHSIGARGGTLADANVTTDLVVIAVTDSAIATVAQALRRQFPADEPIVAHMAGGLDLDPLARWSRPGKMHPIASLASGGEMLRGVMWGTDGDGMITRELGEFVQRFDGWAIPTTHVDLARYHLAAVFASNLVLSLLHTASQLWEQSGAPAPAKEALIPLVRTVLSNWEVMNLDAAITGPAARGDIAAIAAQLRIAASGGRNIEKLYRELSLAAVDLVGRGNRQSEETIAEMARLLAESEVVN